MGATCCKPDPK
jgi:hypothetical protein